MGRLRRRFRAHPLSIISVPLCSRVLGAPVALALCSPLSVPQASNFLVGGSGVLALDHVFVLAVLSFCSPSVQPTSCRLSFSSLHL